MRVYPDAVYLTFAPSFTVNRETGTVRAEDGVRVEWKDGNRWRKLTLLPAEGETLRDVLARIGDIAEGEDLRAWLAMAAH